jgi:1,4-dihydroxy-2-naphthoate octaprenyltransferase
MNPETTPGYIDNLNAMPFLALIAAMCVMAASAVLVMLARYFDRTGGAVTIAIIVVVGFITATYASMIYDIKQTPLTEILVGALAAALGGVVAHYLGTRETKHD